MFQLVQTNQIERTDMTKIVINVSNLNDFDQTSLINGLTEVAKNFGQKVKVSNGVRKAGSDKNSRRYKAAQVYLTLSGSARKDVVTAFMSEVGMSSDGAKTYYQNYRSIWSDDVNGLKW